jgi:hypothetical protein
MVCQAKGNNKKADAILCTHEMEKLIVTIMYCSILCEQMVKRH